MNVSDLLSESPSDERTRRQPNREQQGQPQSQERSRERQAPPQSQQQHQQSLTQQQHGPQHPPLQQHQQQQGSYHTHGSSRHNTRPPSPHGYPHEYGHGQPHRLPPPSAIIGIPDAYDLKHRRPEHEPPPHPLELGMRGHHGPSSPRGPPGPPPPQQYIVDHRPARSQASASASNQPHPHHHAATHGHSNAPSPMYLPPPASRSALTTQPRHVASSSTAPMPPPPGHGSIPLYPTPVGPGMGPPHDPRGPPNYNEPSVMYSGHPHAPPGASVMGALPPHSQPRHHRHPSSGGGGYNSQNGSPAMGSLQRPGHFEEREFGGHSHSTGGNGPVGRPGPQIPQHSQSSGAIGSGMTSSALAHSPGGPPGGSMNTVRSGQPTMPGSSAVGMHRDSIQVELRERERRNAERRERDPQRDRERGHREHEREEERMRERERPREHDMSGLVIIPEGERENGGREWVRKMQVEKSREDVWPRFAPPSSREDQRERDLREYGRDRERRYREEELRSRDAREPVRDVERVEQHGRQLPIGGRAGPLTRELREKDTGRERDGDRDGRRDRNREPRKVSREEHGWLPEPRANEVWLREQQERERDRELRERMQRERDWDRDPQRGEMEAMRPSGQQPQTPHHHHHLHHHHHHSAPSSVAASSSQGYPLTSKPLKTHRPPEPMDVALGPHSMVPPGGMPPPPYGPVMSERIPGSHKMQPKMSNGLGPSQAIQNQLPPQRNMSLHPHAHAIGNSPSGYPPRRTPPLPFANLMNPNASSFMQPHSPRPPIGPTLPPLNLGIFVFPHTPFPFLDFPSPPPDVGQGSNVPPVTEKDVREIRATIFIPNGFLPTQKPKRPRLWGGAPIPSFSPLFASPQLVNHLQSGMSYGFRRPHPLEIHGTRRVYTDDSDLFLCALHAGWVTWSKLRHAKDNGKDLRLEVRLTREARYVGGFGAAHKGDSSDEQSAGEDDDGRTLLSFGWGNSHDGSGIEVLRAEFVKKDAAHSSGLRNRNQRLSEYAQRRSELNCGPLTSSPSPRKRRRYSSPVRITEQDSVITLEARRLDEKLCTERTFVFGNRPGWFSTGFMYDPDTVKSILFDESDHSRPRKRQRLLAEDTTHTDADDPSHAGEADSASILIETLAESFLISRQTTPSMTDDEKENAATSSSLLYTIALVPRSEFAQSSQKTSKKLQSIAVSPEASADQKDAVPAVPTSAVSSMAESEGTSNNAVRLTTIEEPAAVTEPKTTLTGTKDEVKAPATNGDTAKVDTAEGKTKSAGLTSGSRATAPNAEAAATEAVLINGSNAAIVLKPSDVGAESEDSQIGQAVLSPLGETPVKSTETPMDTEKEKDEDVVKPVSKLLPPEDPNSNQEKPVPDVQILQRNLGEDDLIFDTDGISILGNEVENGMRRGWKIKARSWRWAEPLLKETV